MIFVKGISRGYTPCLIDPSSAFSLGPNSGSCIFFIRKLSGSSSTPFDTPLSVRAVYPSRGPFEELSAPYRT
jgi:hypothetical protein